MECEQHECVVQSDSPQRLDVYIADGLKLMTRSQLKARLLAVVVNGKTAKLSRLVSQGDRIDLSVSPLPDTNLIAERIPLDILYEDTSVIVVNKARGMVTHPAQGNWQGTLANALLGRLEAGTGSPVEPAKPTRAGIVHRLDKDTSGVIIAAKTATAQEQLSAQFRERTTRKLYVAIVQGRPPKDCGRIDTWLARDPVERKRFAVSARGTGKRAVSDYRVLAVSGAYALLLLRLHTGRTHQLRVHCRHMSCPILGDPIYGRKQSTGVQSGLMLHAAQLSISLPGESTQHTFIAPLPPDFCSALRATSLPLAAPPYVWQALTDI